MRTSRVVAPVHRAVLAWWSACNTAHAAVAMAVLATIGLGLGRGAGLGQGSEHARASAALLKQFYDQYNHNARGFDGLRNN